MWMAFYALAGVLGLVAFVCALIIVVHAFKTSTGQGLLCVFVPCYILYFAFAKFEHKRKGLILAGMIGSPILAAVSANAATAVFGPDVLQETQGAAGAGAGDEGASGGDEGGKGDKGGEGAGEGKKIDFESDFEDF